MPPLPKPLFETLRALLDAEGEITLGELLDAAGEQIYGLLVLLVALPSLVPGLNLGLAPVGGAGLMALGAQLAWGTTHPWVPRRIQSQPIHKGRIKEALAKLEVQLARFRRRAPLQRPLSPRWMGLCIAWTGFLLALPVPLPFGNQIPASILCLLGAALLEERPTWAWVGAIASLANTVYFASSFGLIVRTCVKAFHALVK
ncbi:exopolysaccharide biosynthesis protein [Geothrix sp. 21YS21S-4]|uniref:exopolysaccharide biosynthesis protein n=1 Tax=Geothrix sp. 21YS21S-4 TaxID=3068889 RepID=UPI0027BB05F6|nr:exopolysaccharide biosynthesis protein [Geothrix sp. 21YS21S-4]